MMNKMDDILKGLYCESVFVGCYWIIGNDSLIL